MVHGVHRDSTTRIAGFHKALYEQRHAFHFSKLRDWLDYSEVSCTISRVNKPLLIQLLSHSKSTVKLVEWSFPIFSLQESDSEGELFRRATLVRRKRGHHPHLKRRLSQQFPNCDGRGD